MAAQDSSSAKTRDLKILAFGDSLTEGYTDFGMTFHPYGPALEAKLAIQANDHEVDVDVNGVSGDCVLQTLNGGFLRRLRASLKAKEDDGDRYDFVIVLGGTNDLAYLLNDADGPSKIFEGLKLLYDLVLASSARLICMTVPERAIDTQSSSLARKARERRIALNGLIADFVTSHATGSKDRTEVFIMDLAAKAPFPRSTGEDEDLEEGLWSPDGLHMSAAGYDFVGDELADFIASELPSC